MSETRTYVAENNVQRERLRGLVTRLSDDDLSRPLDAGWTIAAVLGHLIFWDQRTLVLIDGWKRAPHGAAPRNIDHHGVATRHRDGGSRGPCGRRAVRRAGRGERCRRPPPQSLPGRAPTRAPRRD